MGRGLLFVSILTTGGCAHAPPPLGELVLHVSPPDARVLLDDHDVGSGQSLAARPLRLHPGLRRIEVDADGYYAARREARVTPNGRAELTVALEAIPAGMHD